MLGKKTFSVFTRLFILYSLLIAIMYIVLIGVFQNYINQSTQELIRTKQIQAENFLKNLEQQFDTIYQHEIHLANSANVNKLAYTVYEDNYEKTQIILDLLRTIEGIQGMSPLINDIVISYPSQGILLSSTTGYEKEPGTSWLKMEKGTEYNYFITSGDKLVMNLSYPLMYSENEDYIPDFNIQIVISSQLLEESLSVFNDERGSGGAIHFLLGEDVFIENNHGSTVEQFFTIPADTHEINKDYQFINVESSKYQLSIISFINRQIIKEIKVRYITLLTVVVLILTALYAFSLFYTRRIVIRPLKELMNAFGSIQNGNFKVRIFHEPHDEFNYLYTHFNDSVTYIEELVDSIREQEKLIQHAELAQLQSQINPHFLYNSFFIINRMAKNESYDLITTFVTSLARYYRFINKETNKFIPLSDEVEHMMNYINIQQMRFEDKISVEAENLPGNLQNVHVPKLILQPIIENAYNYGLANKLEEGLIRIRYRQENALAAIIIEDNGDDADIHLVERMNSNLAGAAENNENHALVNINRRLFLAYGDNCGVTVSLSSLGGIQVTLTINPEKLLES